VVNNINREGNIMNKPRIAFDVDDFMFYSTPKDLRALADALEEQIGRVPEGARVQFEAAELVGEGEWRPAMLYRMNDDLQNDLDMNSQPDECGMSFVSGPSHDSYGSNCILPPGHRGKHTGENPYAEGFVMWTGGGTIAGDPVPTRNVEYVEHITVADERPADSGGKCYSCGEYEVVHVTHNRDLIHDPTVDEDGHGVCRNCDHGLCDWCC
jgi:hypothetical protein